MSGTAFGGDVTRVTTTQELPLGFEVTIPDGNNGLQTWIYVYNDSGAELGLILVASGEVTHEAAVTGSAFGNSLAGRGDAGTFTAFIDCRG